MGCLKLKMNNSLYWTLQPFFFSIKKRSEGEEKGNNAGPEDTEREDTATIGESTKLQGDQQKEGAQ